MKIAAIQPLSLSDFPPYCTAIIFTIGCNLRCPYCHNKNLWDENHQPITTEEVFDFLQASTKKLDGVVITGGEPTIQQELFTFIEKIKTLGYKVKLNTNGTNPDCLKTLIGENLLDYIAMDIKAPLNSYATICDTAVSVTSIKESIELISTSNIPHEFRTIWDQKLLKEVDIEAIKSILPKTSTHVLRILSCHPADEAAG